MMSASLVVLLPVFVLFFDPPLTADAIWIVVALFLGIVGVAAIGTLFAAIAVNTYERMEASIARDFVKTLAEAG